MALRKALSKRISNAINRYIPSPTAAPPRIRRDLLTSPVSTPTGFFRRFLQRRTINNHTSHENGIPPFLTLPVGEKLREKLREMNGIPSRDSMILPQENREEGGFSVSVEDVKRVMKFMQMEKVREKLRNIPANTIQHGEFVRICGDVSGNRGSGFELAKVMEECGNVIVLGGVVFLHPDQVAKSIEQLISQSIAMPNDPRRKELDNLENLKSMIDGKARSLVRSELYCGLGFLLLQTLGFMRLTFWELSWDVMEPICFFVTSIHFALAYGFFLRTSKEPTFEGFFQRRFKVKQKKLMKVHEFDVERYNQLCEAFYPNNRASEWKKSVI